MDINEKALLYRAQSGDKKAAEILYERYYREIYTYLYYRVSDSSTAEQFSTEVFLGMLQQRPDFSNHKQTFLGWLYKIASDLLGDNPQKPKPSPLTAHNLETDSPPENTSARDSFQRAIQQLKESQKAIIVHRFVEGRSVQDIAELTHTSERSVRSLQHRALQSLDTALEREKSL